MKTILKNRNFTAFLYVFTGFLLIAAGYVSWVYHLFDTETTWSVTVLSRAIAFLFQALGMGIYTFFSRLRPGFAQRKIFIIPVYILYIFFLFPSMFAPFITGTFLCGFVMNLLCGMIAGGCLHVLAYLVDYDKRGLVFGGGYSLAAVLVCFISLIGHGVILKSTFSILLYSLLAVGLSFLAVKCEKELFKSEEEKREDNESLEENGLYNSGLHNDGLLKMTGISIILSACVVVFASSFIRGAGSVLLIPDIPDIQIGIRPEIANLFFAAGLFLAGIVNDKSRKGGLIAAIPSLVLPVFIILFNKGTVSRTVFLALDLFFFGFLSVYRVLLFSDMSKPEREKIKGLPYGAGLLFGFGFLFGRFGDAVGAQVGVALSQLLLDIFA